MSQDTERVEEFLIQIADRYSAEELVELLGLCVWDVIEAFRDQIIEKHFED